MYTHVIYINYMYYNFILLILLKVRKQQGGALLHHPGLSAFAFSKFSDLVWGSLAHLFTFN